MCLMQESHSSKISSFAVGNAPGCGGVIFAILCWRRNKDNNVNNFHYRHDEDDHHTDV